MRRRIRKLKSDEEKRTRRWEKKTGKNKKVKEKLENERVEV